MTTTSEKGAATRGRRQRVQAVTTGISVLKGLASLGGRASLTALAKQISENPAKVHRYLISLMEEGLIAQDPLSLQYYLGAEAIQIGLAAMRLVDPIRIAEPALIGLRESLGVTCFVAVMGNKGPTIVRFEEPALPVTLNVRVGSVLSLLWSATGRTFLAFMSDSRVERMARDELARTTDQQRRVLDAADPIGMLRQDVRKAGMAIVRDTNLQGISAIAVPLFDFSGKVSAVLTALGATGGFDTNPEGPVARALRQAGETISADLGFVAGSVSGTGK